MILIQSRNAPVPTLVIEFGIVILVRFSQPENAQSSIFVTELPMETSVSLQQFLYLQPVITQYFASNKSEIWS